MAAMSSAGFPINLGIDHLELANTTGSQTWSIRVGPSAAATVNFNGLNAGRRLGGSMGATLIGMELQA